jgi:thioredoxin:protein disulfide reductase
MKRASAAVAAMLIMASGFAMWSGRALAQTAGSQSAASLVKPKTFVSLDSVPQGKPFEAAVVVDIEKGYHMNSHTPSEAYLIATTLTPQTPAGFQVLDTMYPPGKQIKFEFGEKPLDVYSGSVTVKLKMAVAANAAVGAATIPVVIRYQACSETTCLPPVKVPVDLKVNVVAAGTAVHGVHPEIFGGKSGAAAVK